MAAAAIASLLLCACGGGAAKHVGHGAPSATTSASPDAQAKAAARSFLATYVSSSGRVKRIDQGGDTVSEGQAYGMLMAAALGERKTFDSIWSWTRANLMQSDGLLAYHWSGGHVVSATPAADADLESARALLLAGRRFGERSITRAAISLGKAILAHETARAGRLDLLIAGPWASKGSYVVVDPSYIDPAALGALAAATGNPRFSQLASDGRTLVNELTRPLPPDWATVNTTTGVPTPVSAASSTSGPGMFTFDAPRTLVWFAVGPAAADRTAVARAWSVFSATAPKDIVTEHQLDGAPAGSDHNPVTLVAVAAAAKAAGDDGAVDGLLNEATTLNRQHPTYYGAAWLALGRLLLSTDLLRAPR